MKEVMQSEGIQDATRKPSHSRDSRAIEIIPDSDSDGDSDFCCPICLDSFDAADTDTTCASFNCGHKVCAACFTKFLTYRIVDGYDSFPTCHLAFCDSVASNRLLERYISPEVFRLVTKRQKERQARGPNGRYLFCQSTACVNSGRPPQPLQAPPLSNIGEAAFITRCPECEEETCVRCGGAAHYGEQCKRNTINNNSSSSGSLRGYYMLRAGLSSSNIRLNNGDANSFWGNFAYCSKCLSTTHSDSDDDVFTCCGEEMVVLRTHSDFYRFCRKLSWRLFLRSDFSDFIVRFTVVHIITLWFAFWVITWRRPFLLLFSLMFLPSLLAKVYNIIRHALTIGVDYVRLFSAEPVAATSSDGSHSSNNNNTMNSNIIEIDL